MTPPGQRDYSTVRISRHALERFIERFAAVPESAPDELRGVLSRTRRLGRNPDTGAIAVVAVFRSRVLVAILQDTTCLTVLTWNQFAPRLGEFGRSKLPRKWGRILRRLTDPADSETTNPTDPEPLRDDLDPTSLCHTAGTTIIEHEYTKYEKMRGAVVTVCAAVPTPRRVGLSEGSLPPLPPVLTGFPVLFRVFRVFRVQ